MNWNGPKVKQTKLRIWIKASQLWQIMIPAHHINRQAQIRWSTTQHLGALLADTGCCAVADVFSGHFRPHYPSCTIPDSCLVYEHCYGPSAPIHGNKVMLHARLPESSRMVQGTYWWTPVNALAFKFTWHKPNQMFVVRPGKVSLHYNTTTI